MRGDGPRRLRPVPRDCRGRERGWSSQALAADLANIRYLLGQLAAVHKDLFPAPPEALFDRYDGARWTDSGAAVDDLLALGGQCELCFPTPDGLELNTALLRPTLSPADPAFPAWYASADGLMVQGDLTRAEGKYAEALRLLEREAEQGDPEAQFKCGAMYESGIGTASDKARALSWYEQAARQGHGEAQLNCAMMYFRGAGAPCDPARALCWYQRAARQGIAQAQYSCGILYERGWIVEADEAAALSWYERAAEQGHRDAQLECARRYEEGLGAPVDHAAARCWRERAGRQD